MAFTALAAGVSGLQSFTEGVGVIADNITNVNTIGYKETRSRFSTLVTETSSASSYSPGGVRAFSDTLVSKQGLLQPSSSATDLSIDGAGFFLVRNGTNGTDTTGDLLYTRAGSFTQDKEGYFVNTGGNYLLGWPTDSDGNVISESNYSPININNLNGLGSATSKASMRVNLDSSTAITSPYTVGDIADTAASTSPAESVTPDFQSNITVYDSQGGAHDMNIAAVKTGVNTWSYEMYFDDPSTSTPPTSGNQNGLVGYGNLVFNTDGSIDLTSSTMIQASDDTSVGFNNPLSFSYTTTSGNSVDAGSVSFDFGTDGEKDGFVQSATETAKLSSNSDGAAFGSVNGVAIGDDGVVTATFSNGLTLPVYKLPIMVFQNPDGLSRRAGNAFAASDLSGTATPLHAGQSGAGKISPNSLEQSTVDLASEFAELIKVQRAFSASSRIITTADQILQELTRV